MPDVDALDLRELEWILITPENAEEVFADLEGDKVLFGLTDKGYENIALNLGDIRSLIQQYKTIIAIYDKQWENNSQDSSIESSSQE